MAASVGWWKTEGNKLMQDPREELRKAGGVRTSPARPAAGREDQEEQKGEERTRRRRRKKKGLGRVTGERREDQEGKQEEEGERVRKNRR